MELARVQDAPSPGAIVSESTLFSFLKDAKALRRSDLGPALPRAELAEEDLTAVLARYRRSIDARASALAATAVSNLENVPSGCLYRRLEDRTWRQAGLICEIFRNPDISKNAGWLETHTLQARLAAGLGGRALRFAIAWGQAKREAAGLKTVGPMADFAELFALARLVTVVKAVKQVTGRADVKLNVLSGGERFRAALLSRPRLSRAYDEQRTSIAAMLSPEREIDVEPYSDPGASTEPLVAGVDDDLVARHFSTVLMNVDWSHVFGVDGERPVLAPHDIEMPVVVRDWLEGRDGPARRTLIRAAIVGIADPASEAFWEGALGGAEYLLDETIAFVRTVAWESTRKYVALQGAAANEARSDDAPAAAPIVRLTVHEKRARRDLPALLTLGRQGGNLLSQHVISHVPTSGPVRFTTVAELGSEKARPVMLRSSSAAGGSSALFGWLAEREQPLCFVDASVENVASRLASVLDA